MSYRLKLTITISLLIALSFGIGGTLMMTTSFHETLEQETQTALSAFETIQNTLYLFHSLGSQTDLGGLSGNLSQMEGTGHWQALCLSSGEEIFFQSGETGMLAYTLPIPTSDLCSYLSVSDAYGHGLVIANRMRAGETEMVLMARFDVSHAYAMRRTQLGQYVLAQVVLLNMGFAGILRNAVLLFFAYLPRTALGVVWQVAYWAAIALLYPLSTPVVVLCNFWVPALLSLMAIYPGLDQSFSIEENIRKMREEQLQNKS